MQRALAASDTIHIEFEVVCAQPVSCGARHSEEYTQSLSM